MLIDPLDAPRRALARQLVTHLGAAALTEARSVADALTAAPPGDPAPWDAVVVSATDGAAAGAAIAAMRTALPALPVLVMAPPDEAGRGTAADWPAGVVRVDRPARLATLAAALRDLLQGAAAPTPAGFALGPFLCNPSGRLMTDRASGRTVSLTEKEAAILDCLHAAAAPVSRDSLLAEVWGYADGVASHTLETHIHRLRRKIERDPREPALLVKDTAGYRLGG
ncbi:winged helix-turn-helix domain-containing protein [Roseospira navarrensis]|uniref:OmpR/PhoB-type domain-containing protein n=1 Tax=Roseospira navarrensis TaxID=140058 RepID=A0A7X1ZD22_9PROT|nr:helix-turn-helix domain-containing protein [Roseospira navarrensis]MQX36102.1 hypothetical protein [Roseospira navarrensis]